MCGCVFGCGVRERFFVRHLAGWCINVTHASTAGRQIYDTLGTCTFLSLHCCRLLTFCQSVCCYGNAPLPFSDQNPNLNPPPSPYNYPSLPPSLPPSLAHTDFPSLYDSMYCLIMWPSSQVGKQSTDHNNTSTQTPKQSSSPTKKIFTREEILVVVSKKKQHVVWKEKIYFSPVSQNNESKSNELSQIMSVWKTLLLYLLPPLLCDWLTSRLHVVPLSLHAHIHAHPTHRP